MMNDLWADIQADMRMLDRAVAEYKQRGFDLAHANDEYHCLLAKAILEERQKGTPATIMKDVCYGRREIATARCKRDCAEVLYESCREGINALKLQIRVNNDQLQREWTQSGMSQAA